MSVKPGSGAGHAAVMGKRSALLESLHRQQWTVLREAAARMCRGNKKDGARGTVGFGGGCCWIDIPKRSRRNTPSKQSGIAPLWSDY